MFPNYRRNGRSQMSKHLASLGSQSLISSLTDHLVVPGEGADYEGEGESSSLEIVGTMSIDTRRLLNQQFSSRINFSKPIRLGYYSISFDSFHKMDFIRDASALRYLCCPKHGRVNINLLYGFNGLDAGGGGGGRGRGYRRGGGGGSPKKFHFLEWIAINKKDLMSDKSENGDFGVGDDGASNATGADEKLDENKDTFADFVCDAFLLKTIMSTPYISSETAWTIVAIKIKGVIYMVELKNGQPFNLGSGAGTAATAANAANAATSSYAGLKFKEMISVRFDGSHSSLNSKGNRDSFWMVCKTNIGSHHRVLYNARTDCVLDDQQLTRTIDEASFVELRTRPSSLGSGNAWERRAIAWWLSSILTGSKLIFCGERDEDFFVRKVTKIYVDSLPKQRYKWSPKNCVDFLDETLSFIKSSIDDEMKPFRFSNLGDQIICTKLNEPVEKFISASYILNSMYEIRDIVPSQFDTQSEDNDDDEVKPEIKEEPEESEDRDSDTTNSCTQSDQETEVHSETDPD